ncbi:ATP-binding protein [Mucilaginibacter sp.]|uniref:ATP-binding protein n=1 Tax=Mucilaginibacter sp. TaxID=1882438 RepID=UPI0028444365|nr:ATP-binding protein [Mucilaginibacter sp.]MDR3695504.1 ATP-binding protein [Mucilaginibacter sp.]
MAVFKARARALDLLGRQQIAGIPTAINELFKNAHDAYADNVDIDYFRKSRLLILRDNGLGMTKHDFETRWLTLGTESKFLNNKFPAPPKHPDKPERPIMGEKGIGRLAIASIGRQVLILTKAYRKSEKHPIVAAFINWGLFELPGLNLEDIVIPVREFDSLPSGKQIDEMKKEVINAILILIKQDEISKSDGAKLITEIKGFVVSPDDLDKVLIPTTAISNEKYGTHFYISPVDETLNSDIDGESETKEATKIEKMLVGFTNTMTPNFKKPDIDAAFRDYRNDDDTYFSLLEKEQFFTPKDFELADHHFQGKFDIFGQFLGKIKVYNEKEFDHKILWNGNNYRETDCGAFSINVAYVQGRLAQSMIDPENHGRLLAKADKFGGLYIYRDNIRILPYGNSDYDFIDIEKNRTKSASFYFFSFRRMFGVIDISKKVNFKLNEKAGREGFIENKAYRQLREILKNFFVQLAADFFREGGGPKTDFWIKRRSQQEAIYKSIERRDKQTKFRKDKFQSSLTIFFKDLSEKKFQTQIDEFMEATDKKIGSVAYLDDPDEATQKLLDYEIEARQKLESLKGKIKINQPRGFSISKDLRQDFESYLVEYEKVVSTLFVATEEKIDDLINEYTTRLQLEISKRKRLEQAVDFISQEAKKATNKKEKETKEAVSNITQKVKELTTEVMSGLEDKIRDVKDQFKSMKIEDVQDFDLVSERKRMEDEILKEKNRGLEIFESIIKQIESIYWGEDPEGNIVTNDQMNDALTEELYELRDRIHADVELSQLGLAVGVIHHEFNSTVNSIRASIKDLKAWADVNQQLEGVYDNIRINFEHLDGYLTLFTPLNRRLSRTQEKIPANDIKVFLIDLFKARLSRHNIQLKHTKGFSSRSLFGYRSTFYPVFVNVVDNAIHWLNQKKDTEEKIIRLHADDSGFYISNNGPAILINEKERIFDLGFTRKMNGRGMGLHISREALEGIKYKIFVDEPKDGSNVTFKIEPNQSTQNE